MEITVEVNVAAVRALLNSQNQRINRAMRAALTDASVLVLKHIRTYPAQRPGSTYDRTGNLAKSWTRRPPEGYGLEMSALVGSDAGQAPYNIYVQHPELQAAVHVGRWQTTADVVRRDTAAVQRYFDVRMREAFAGT